jgi:hypothetical protein
MQEMTVTTNRLHKWIGGVLILLGLVFLLQQSGLVPFAWGMLWMLLFAGGGGIFLAVSMSRRENWWALIPWCTLLGIAALIGTGVFFPAFAERWGGGIFLGSIAIAFVGVYLNTRENWWAIIPGGVLATLATVAVIGPELGWLSGGLFFLGIAATFLAVYLLPTPMGRMTWAIIPSGITAGLGFLVLFGSGPLAAGFWPLLLIGTGMYLLIRALVKR